MKNLENFSMVELTTSEITTIDGGSFAHDLGWFAARVWVGLRDYSSNIADNGAMWGN